jgi:ribA/ribD-fused uncharacterized protein
MNLHDITSFEDNNRFLSNFYASPIRLFGVTFPTVEHAYQAFKADTTSDVAKILVSASPGHAKKVGRSIVKRSDWDQIRIAVMYFLLRLKFQDRVLKNKLLATGDVKLIEGNVWGDTFWGICDGQGRNWLGQLLMMVRDDLRAEAEAEPEHGYAE